MSHKNKNNHSPQDGKEESAATENPAPETPAPEETTPAAPETNPLETELAALKDRYARLMADFDNYRKRQLREREEMVRRANENLLEDILPFLDTLDIALANGNPDDPFVKGMCLAAEQLSAILAKNGMTPVAVEGDFNANTHEALTHIPSAGTPEGGIISQVRRGWMLHERLLRAAQVVVSAGAPAAEDA